jgi:predicted nicotinamide N-methyase
MSDMAQIFSEEFFSGTVGQALFDLAGKVSVSEISMLDGLRLSPVPMAPEIQLHLAEDAILFWARLEAERQAVLPTPFWASAWAGGQALARYLLDHPQSVMGRRVLDLGSGSGLVGIAAAKAGATSVLANDIDPYAIAAATMNARENGVTLDVLLGDILDQDGGDAEVILAGDALYRSSLANPVLDFLRRARDRGAEVLIGDPGRGYLPPEVELLASYRLTTAATFADSQLEEVQVLRLK